MKSKTLESKPPVVSGVTVLGLDKEVVPLSSLWQERRIVLTFIRHFG